MKCRVCSEPMRFVFEHLVLRKYQGQYHQCDACGLLQVENPHWLKEAYADAIIPADTGILQRNLYLSDVAAALLFRLFPQKSSFLDAAGGYGILTRLMRDKGFNFYWSDRYAENLVARGFEARNGPQRYAAITAFEVLEHVQDPVEFLSELMESTGARSLLMSTELYAGESAPPTSWWYYTFNAGQHITFYRHSTLVRIAEILGLRLHSANSVHLMTDRKLSGFEYRSLVHHRISHGVAALARLRLGSLTWRDHTDLMVRKDGVSSTTPPPGSEEHIS